MMEICMKGREGGGMRRNQRERDRGGKK